jgi:signal transduction histidine kinase
MSIRLKVILPYLLLTVVVAVIGVYVVTRLVAKSLSDRLNNQLIEAGRVAADNFVRLESGHVDTARSIMFIEGLMEAMDEGDRERAFKLAGTQLLGEGGAQNLILVTSDGREFLHVYANPLGEVILVEQDTGAVRQPIVLPHLQRRNVEEPPHRAMGINLANNEIYYYTSLSMRNNDEFAGVIVVGTPIRGFIYYLKSNLQTDITIYSSIGQVVATTIGTAGPEILEQIPALQTDDIQAIFSGNEETLGRNFQVDGRDYRLVYAPWQVGNDLIGVYAVSMSSQYVLESGNESRWTYIQLFSALMLVVIMIGFLISRMITRPLYSLVTTSQEIASGALEKRSDIRTRDEIEELSRSFNEMTARLQDRTLQLEETNQKLEKINEKLRKIDLTKTNFIQISAHELRTPLTLIMGYSQMLEQDTQDNPELFNLAQGILEGSERMADIVDSMLDASRIDSNALVIKKSTVELAPIIKKVNRGFMDAFMERNISFSTEGLDDLPAISADADLLQKVFYHLVMNAIKFTPDGGSVIVHGRSLNGDGNPQVEVAVCDTGIGIDPSSLETIFEKFSQTGEVLLHSSGKTKFKGGGPGLGLAIARGIIEAHGGRIHAESPGYSEETFPGSKFIVHLPAAPVEPAAMEKHKEVVHANDRT